MMKMYISEKIIRQARQSHNVVDVISKYVRLEKSGNIYLGLSPFRAEKAPSLLVDEKKQIWHDLSSGKSGDCIKFLTDYHNISVDKALKMLLNGAEKGLEGSSGTGADVLKESIYEIYEEAARFYRKKLTEKDGAEGKKYLESREMDDSTISNWDIGMAPDCWGNKGSLYYYLSEKGFDTEILKRSGLFKENKKGGLFDMYRNRVMFPIKDENSRVVGFGGRILTSPDVKDQGQGPKYMNSPGSIIFDKSTTLFGLDQKLRNTRREMILCEGFMDVISLHQAGFTDAVASLGTALTKRQCEIIKKHADTVYLTYDADAAGIKAGVKAMYYLKKEGLDVKVISTKPFKDPDEMIQKMGAGTFRKRIDNAKDVFAWFMDIAKQGVKSLDVKKGEKAPLNENNKNSRGGTYDTPSEIVEAIWDGFDVSVPAEKSQYEKLIATVYANIHPNVSKQGPMRTKSSISKNEFLKEFHDVVELDVKDRTPSLNKKLNITVNRQPDKQVQKEAKTQGADRG